jgi:hypothetical protein
MYLERTTTNKNYKQEETEIILFVGKYFVFPYDVCKHDD